MCYWYSPSAGRSFKSIVHAACWWQPATSSSAGACALKQDQSPEHRQYGQANSVSCPGQRWQPKMKVEWCHPMWEYSWEHVRATLHHIMGLPFQEHYWEDDTKIPLSRGNTNDNVNHNNRDTLQYKSMGVRHDRTWTQYMQAPWLTQWAMDLSCTGRMVILRDQAEVWSYTWYEYIPHRVPTELGMDEHHWVEP